MKYELVMLVVLVVLVVLVLVVLVVLVQEEEEKEEEKQEVEREGKRQRKINRGSALEKFAAIVNPENKPKVNLTLSWPAAL